jgi:hypothetical protein
MNKISKAFKTLGLIIRKPYLLNLINDDEQVKQNYVARKYKLPNGFPSIDIANFISLEEIKLKYSNVSKKLVDSISCFLIK